MPPYGDRRAVDSEPRRRKHTRLPDKTLHAIRGQVVHVVIGTKGKQPHFAQPDAAESLVKAVKEAAGEKRMPIYAYCVMPDHVHLLVGGSETCGVIEFVKIVKGRFVTSWRRRGGERSPFQKSFYDHIMRDDEDVYVAAEYIVGNPVRAGLTKELGEYPYAGSLVWEL